MDNRAEQPNLAIAVGTQPGMDGKHLVSVHLGNNVLSVAVAFPADKEISQNIADTLHKQILDQAAHARRINSGLVLP